MCTYILQKGLVPEVPVEVLADPAPLEPEEAGYHWVGQQMP